MDFVGVTLVISGIVLGVVRERKIGARAISGPFEPNLGARGIGKFLHEGPMAWIVAVVMVWLGLFLLLLS